MSKFKTLLENLLIEYDRDDPSDNPWLAADNFKREQAEKRELATKLQNIKNTIPITKRDLVYLKVITEHIPERLPTNIMYLTGNKKFPYTYDKEKAKKFDRTLAEYFLKKHPDPIITSEDVIPEFRYKKHFEIEEI